MNGGEQHQSGAIEFKEGIMKAIPAIVEALCIFSPGSVGLQIFQVFEDQSWWFEEHTICIVIGKVSISFSKSQDIRQQQ